MKRYQATGFILATLVAMGLVGRSDHQAEELEFRHYCRMVELHRRTGGELGWPDYRGLADECGELE